MFYRVDDEDDDDRISDPEWVRKQHAPPPRNSDD